MNPSILIGGDMKYLASAAALSLFTGVVAVFLAASPIVAMGGKFVIATAAFVLALIAATHVLRQGFAAHALRNEDFHWY